MKKLSAHFLIFLLLAAFALSASPALAESPPRTPSSVSVSRSDGSLTASWPAVKNATSYHVTYSTDGGASWSLAALNHGGTSITISVNNSKSYIVGVRARNSAGDSVWRNSYAIGPYNPPKPPPPPKPPATPGVITVSRSDGALHAFWNSVGGATSYHVTYTGDNGVSWSLAALNHPAGNGTTSITITGVDNDKPYIVGVRSRNSAGDSGWRNSSSTGRYEPPPAPPKPPAAPTALSATGSDKSVTLSWNKPTGDVTGYQFQFRAAPPAPGWGDWYTVPYGDGNTTRYTVKGLENGTEYRFKLRAVNSGAVSAPAPTSAPWYVSAIPDPNVQPPPPPKPPSAPPAPKSVTATRVNGNIVGSWHHSEGATGYDVRYSTDKGGSWKLAAWGWNTSVITIKDASGDKSYIVGVRAVNLVGESDWTNSNTVEALGRVSVSNLGEDATDAQRKLGQFQNTNYRLATGFTTGSRSGGYTLQSVTVSFGEVVGTPTGFTAAIHAASGGNPAESATYTLTGSKPTASGVHTFTCSGSCGLSPGTPYFLVLSATGPAGAYNFYYVNVTASGGQTKVPSSAAWTIADEGKSSEDGGGWTTTTVSGNARILMFKVTATKK